MNAFAGQVHGAKVIVIIYVLGLLFQTIYLPYQARQSVSVQAAASDAEYSFVWEPPIYYDRDKHKNISITEFEKWEKNNMITSLDMLLHPELELKYSKTKTRPLPDAWIRIFGIDYKRLLLTLSLWTVVMGGIFFVLKKKEE